MAQLCVRCGKRPPEPGSNRCWTCDPYDTKDVIAKHKLYGQACDAISHDPVLLAKHGLKTGRTTAGQNPPFRHFLLPI